MPAGSGMQTESKLRVNTHLASVRIMCKLCVNFVLTICCTVFALVIAHHYAQKGSD